MRRSALAAALLMLTPGLRSARGWEDPPPLTPPALEPPAESPSTAAPAAKATTPPAAPAETSHRPMLVIPGVTAPDPSRTVRKPAYSPSLDGPAASLGRPVPDDEDSKPGVTLSLTLEPIPPDDAEESREPRPIHVQEARPARAQEAEPPAPPSQSAEPAPRRSLGVLGRLLGSEGDSTALGDGITIEPHSDPALEAAVKRRVEKQILDELGDRVHDVQVFVKGREIFIRARASRFWHRRSARRTLDALPLPSGYRGRVEMD